MEERMPFVNKTVICCFMLLGRSKSRRKCLTASFFCLFFSTTITSFCSTMARVELHAQMKTISIEPSRLRVINDQTQRQGHYPSGGFQNLGGSDTPGANGCFCLLYNRSARGATSSRIDWVKAGEGQVSELIGLRKN